MKQKFSQLQFVRVGKDSHPEKMYFPTDFDAIVKGTYSQLYGGGNITDYSLYKIRNGKIVDNVSWYEESQLTALEQQDRDKAEGMVEEYNTSR